MQFTKVKLLTAQVISGRELDGEFEGSELWSGGKRLLGGSFCAEVWGGGGRGKLAEGEIGASLRWAIWQRGNQVSHI